MNNLYLLRIWNLYLDNFLGGSSGILCILKCLGYLREIVIWSLVLGLFFCFLLICILRDHLCRLCLLKLLTLLKTIRKI